MDFLQQKMLPQSLSVSKLDFYQVAKDLPEFKKKNISLVRVETYT